MCLNILSDGNVANAIAAMGPFQPIQYPASRSLAPAASFDAFFDHARDGLGH
jgi:hypothetical protein